MLESSGGVNVSSGCSLPDWFIVSVERPSYVTQLGICGSGLVLNSITLIVFMTGHEFKGAPFVFMSALALSDMCNLLLRAPECFVMAYRKALQPQPLLLKHTKLILYVANAVALSPLSNVTESVSVWLTVFLALERYVSMRHIGMAKSLCTSSTAGTVTAFGVAVAFVINAFWFFGIRAHLVQEQNETYVAGKPSVFYHTRWYDGLAWTRAVLSQFLPLVFLAVANIRLLLALRRQSRRMQKYRSADVTPGRRSQRQIAQRRLTVMLVAVICLVLFGQVPQAFSFHSLFSILFQQCSQCSTLDNCMFYRQYKLVTNSLNLPSYACNFCIYFALNRHFRARALLLVTCGRRGRRPSVTKDPDFNRERLLLHSQHPQNEAQDEAQYEAQDEAAQYEAQDEAQYEAQDEAQYEAQDGAQYEAQDEAQYEAQDEQLLQECARSCV